MTLIKFSGKPIEKLIETFSAAIGTVYKPRAIRKEADAEAYRIEVIEIAKAKSSMMHAEANAEIVERAKQRFINQEVNRQINLENVVEKSTQYLEEKVSDQPVDEDWRTRFFNKAQDISSDEMQEIWAKILANEVSQPGSVSLRTLEIVGALSKIEAEIFQRAATITALNGNILKINNENSFDEFGLTFSDLLILKAANLLYSESLTLKFNYIPGLEACLLIFGEKAFTVKKDNSTDIIFNVIALTPAGAELARTLNIKPDYNYLEKFIEEKSKLGYIFKETNIRPVDSK